MPINYKVLGQQNPAAATNANLYVVPANTQSIVSCVNVTNLSAANMLFRLAVRPAGATLSNVHYIAYDNIVPGQDSIVLNMGITMGNTDILACYATQANLVFHAYGTELT